MQNFSWKKLKGEFLCETYEYVGESTENIDNKIGSGRTADRAQRQGLENTPVRHLVPCCAEKIDCCPHITGFIKKKKNCFAGIDGYNEWPANDYEKWGEYKGYNQTEKYRDNQGETQMEV